MQAQSSNSPPVEVTELSSSDYFGELALLNDEARQASVIAKTKVVSFSRSFVTNSRLLSVGGLFLVAKTRI
jgi:CRP-like cAMP-binding protein